MPGGTDTNSGLLSGLCQHIGILSRFQPWGFSQMIDAKPVFVVTADANDSLASMLREKVLPQIRQLVNKRAVTVVFDRDGWMDGWSPNLFQEIISQSFHVLPDPKTNTLFIRMHPLANVRSKRAMQALCGELNKTKTLYPDTDWILHYRTASDA
ncbi:hypothetical protein ACFLW6_00970 [Chloroflexota bacterium]